MHIGACKAIRRSDKNTVKGTSTHRIASVIPSRTLEASATPPIVTKDMLVGQGPPALMNGELEAVTLLINRLIVHLVRRRNTDVDRYAHDDPPGSLVEQASVGTSASGSGSIAAPVDKLGPSVGDRRAAVSPADELASVVSCDPPRCTESGEG
jgi:hypothetical protein